jgi:hypothetical protein
MSRRREQDLAQRREDLVARSAAQRRDLARHAEPLVRKGAALDRIVAKVREYPVMTALVVGGVALLSTRRVFSAATRVLTLYALLRK